LQGERRAILLPANDRLLFPEGDQYLINISNSAQVRGELAVLRQQHRTAVNNLLEAIARNRVETYLSSPFTCPN